MYNTKEKNDAWKANINTAVEVLSSRYDKNAAAIRKLETENRTIMSDLGELQKQWTALVSHMEKQKQNELR